MRAPAERVSPPLLEPGDRADLRDWLAANHATSTGVRLAIGKKGNTRTALTYDDAVEEGLAFGWIDSTTRTLDDDRYTVLFTPRKPGSTWAASNKARVAMLTEAGLMAPAGLAAVAAARANGSWDLLTDVDALVVPDDLTAALAETPGAAEGFESLSPSARKMALYWVGTAKRPATRADRIERTVAAALEGRTPIG